MYVRSLGERAAPPSSWSRAVTTFYGPLYLAVSLRCWSCLRCTGLWYFLGDDFWNQLQYSVPMLGSTANTFCVSFRDFLRIQRCAWFNYGYMHCVSLRSLLKTLTHFLSAGGLREMTSGLSPYSALSLVRQRIHALRQSTRLSGSAWFFSGR